MPTDTLAAVLEREHREIDDGIEAFLAGRGQERVDAEPLTRAIDALRRHIFLEEAFLFPPLSDAGMLAPVFVMLREHGEIWDTTEMLEAQLRTGVFGASMFETCGQLLEQLDRHNCKEEPILYPRADEVLGGAARASLDTFLEKGRLPEGWRCAQAGPA